MVQAEAGASAHLMFRFCLPAMCLLAASTLSTTFSFLIVFTDKQYMAAGLFCLVIAVITPLYTTEFWFTYVAMVTRISRRIGVFFGGTMGIL
jgi:hypothetical protein